MKKSISKIFLKSLLVLIFCLEFGQILGQGCSSAGFCTMGALKADQKFGIGKSIKLNYVEISQKLNYVEISQLIAFSGLGETINATTLDISVTIF